MCADSVRQQIMMVCNALPTVANVISIIHHRDGNWCAVLLTNIPQHGFRQYFWHGRRFSRQEANELLLRAFDHFRKSWRFTELMDFNNNGAYPRSLDIQSFIQYCQDVPLRLGDQLL